MSSLSILPESCDEVTPSHGPLSSHNSRVGSSVGCSSVSASSPLSGLFGPAPVVPWTRFYELQVVVSGYALQCKPRSLIFSTVLNVVSN
nr:hypothetical protein CFP56_32622 [Quercus suber]